MEALGFGRYIGRYQRYIGDIGRYIDRFVSKRGFTPRTVFVIDIVFDISVIYRYIADIDRYFLIFPSFDFCLLISCRESSTLEMSTIYRRYIATFPSLILTRGHRYILPLLGVVNHLLAKHLKLYPIIIQKGTFKKQHELRSKYKISIQESLSTSSLRILAPFP